MAPNQPFETSAASSFSLEDVFTHVPVSVVLTDAHGKILRHNELLAKLFGSAELTGRMIQEFGLNPGHRSSQEEQSRSRTAQITSELRDVIVKPTIKVLHDDAGQASGLLWFLTEEAGPRAENEADEECLDRLNRTEIELVAARELSVRALSAKSDFLSNMSHELRTPLNAVIGMSEVLWETDLSEDQRKVLQVLRNGGRNLLSIINDILEYSRLENGQLPLQVLVFELGSPLRSVEELVRKSAEEKGLSLRFEVESPGEKVHGDPQRLEQVLLNLIGNAVKFTDHGSITVRVSRDPDARGQVRFSIEDTGIGIAPEKLNDLFKRFSQIDMSITKSYGGTGLGLAISKQLVELMGGAIWVESEKGRGTRFHFAVSLPVAASDAPVVSANAGVASPTAPASAPLASRSMHDGSLPHFKILVVEDSKDNAFLIGKFLRNVDCELEFAENGREAVDKFERGSYDLILMDMQMPEMDGYAATRWIRILERRTSHRVPIIALTAFAFAEEVRKSFDAGCDAHLSKPIDKRSLLNAIAQRLAESREAHDQHPI